MSEEVKNEKELTISDILEFVRSYWVRGVIRGVISLGILLVIFVLCYFFLPRKEFYNRDIMLLLQRTVPESVHKNVKTFREEVLCYPNSKPFVNTDLISVPVLKAVYEKNNLKNKVNFEDFAKAFAVSDYSVKLAKVEAAYRARLATRNIRVAEINDIEKVYQEQLKNVPSDWLTVSAEKISGVSTQEMAGILNDIPREWYRIYSVTEGKVTAQLPSSQLLSKLDNRYGRLAALEKMRAYAAQFENVIREMNVLIQDRNIALKSGETLGDLLTEVRNIRQFQLAMLQQMLLGVPVLRSEFDLLFAKGKEFELERELEKVESRGTAAVTALEMLSAKDGVSVRGGVKAAGGSTQMVMDASFINSITTMIRNDANNAIRMELLKQVVNCKTQAAELKVEKNYFAKLRQSYNDTGRIKGSVPEYDRIFNECLKELKSVVAKINQFKELITEEYALERNFYVTLDSVKLAKNMIVPPSRLTVGVIGIWALLNLIWLAVAFVKKYKM